MAWASGYVFTVQQAVQPGLLIAAVDPDQPRTWIELLFLSFTNPLQHGPLRRRAHQLPERGHLVIILQLTGLGYVAVVVSRLIAFTHASQHANAAASRAVPEDPPGVA